MNRTDLINGIPYAMQGLNSPQGLQQGGTIDRSVPEDAQPAPTSMGWSDSTFMEQARQLAGNQQGWGRFAGLNSPYAKYLNPSMNMREEHGGGKRLMGLEQSPMPQMPPPWMAPQMPNMSHGVMGGYGIPETNSTYQPPAYLRTLLGK